MLINDEFGRFDSFEEILEIFLEFFDAWREIFERILTVLEGLESF